MNRSSSPPPSVQRSAFIDVARGIAMFLVMYGHALILFVDAHIAVSQDMFRWNQVIYSFHMPLFFLIAGMVFKRRGHRQALASALTLLLVAYIVHVGLWLPFSWVRHGGFHLATLVWPLLTLNGFTTGVVWFLAALAVVQLAHHLLTTLQGGARWAMLAAVLSVSAACQYLHTNLLQLATLGPALLFHALGQRIATLRYARAPVRPGLALGLALVLGLATIRLAPLNSGCTISLSGACPNVPSGFLLAMTSGEFGNYPCFLLTALAGSLAVLGLARWIADRGGTALAASVWLGRRTLEMLIVNGVFCWFVQPGLARYLTGVDVWQAAVVSLGLVLVQFLAYGIARPLLAGIKNAAAHGAARLFGCLPAKPLRMAPAADEPVS